MTTDADRTRQLDWAVAHMLTIEGDAEREQFITSARRDLGTASRLYIPGNSRWSRWWNWAFNTEYTSPVLAPVWWFVLIAANVAFPVAIFLTLR